MSLKYNAMVSRLIDLQDSPPKTSKYDKENFTNMNIFSKIETLDNKKNSSLTEKMRRVIRQKVSDETEF